MSEPVFNPLDEAFQRDPYPVYRRFREREPIHWSEAGGFWLLTAHEDIAWVLKDRRFGRDWGAQMEVFYGPAWREEPIWQYSVETLLFMNPPAHTRIRKLVSHAFTAKRIEGLKPRIFAITDGLIDQVIDDGGMEVCTQFANPLPVQVICEMLGVPAERVGEITRLVRTLMLSFEVRPLSREELDACNDALATMEAYFRAEVAERKRRPREDLLTVLVQAESEGDRLSERELIWNVIQIFAGGFETTANAIGNALLALFQQPAALTRLREQVAQGGELPLGAVEELFRYDISTQIGGRNAMMPVEYKGHRFETGQALFLALGAGNRDPAVYRPDPDVLDLDRGDVKPVTFGGGIHYCLGHQLARIEGQAAFTRLFQRLPTLELPEADAPQWRRTATIRGLERLPARW